MLSSNSNLPLKPSAPPSRKSHDRWTWLIAIGKSIYGLILVAVGLSIFNLIGKNLSVELWRLVDSWHIDSHLYYINWLLHQASHVNDHQLWWLISMNFIYAALSFIEAIGLVLGKRWAQWLVIADTTSFIPLGIYQLCQSFGWINLSLVAVYFTIVVYLIRRLKSNPLPVDASSPPMPLTLLRTH